MRGLTLIARGLSIPFALMLSFSLGAPPQAISAAPGFQQAVQDYSGGNYSLALWEFEAVKAANPNNALVHYYIALCQQSLNHMQEARTEFEFVAAHGDAKLAQMAKTVFLDANGKVLYNGGVDYDPAGWEQQVNQFR